MILSLEKLCPVHRGFIAMSGRVAHVWIFRHGRPRTLIHSAARIEAQLPVPWSLPHLTFIPAFRSPRLISFKNALRQPICFRIFSSVAFASARLFS